MRIQNLRDFLLYGPFRAAFEGDPSRHLTTNVAIAGPLAKMSRATVIEAIGDIGTVGAAGKIIPGPECLVVRAPAFLSSAKCV